MAALTRLLTVNAGSSSVKLWLLDHSDETLHALDLPADRGRVKPHALHHALGMLGPVDAVGHRVVHGGERFTAPVLVDDDVLAELRRLIALAPLHQPPALAALEHTRAALPGVPAVACFDTAFHASLPPAASTYAIPQRWRGELGVRRYGFHGLAHQFAARRACQLAPRARRVVVAHLGSGASLCAVFDGRSVDTTMGFTPTAGLVMGSRCGDLDPAVPGWLIEHKGLPPEQVSDALDQESGLLGLAGDADMRAVLHAERNGARKAVLAIQVWLHRLRAGIAAMTAALGGIDALVFTGGIGEHAADLRRRAVTGLAYLGLAVDPEANAAVRGADVDIAAAGTATWILVVHVREELIMAEQVRMVLGEPKLAPVVGGGAGRW
jgi:acetate kinase